MSRARVVVKALWPGIIAASLVLIAYFAAISFILSGYYYSNWLVISEPVPRGYSVIVMNASSYSPLTGLLKKPPPGSEHIVIVPGNIAGRDAIVYGFSDGLILDWGLDSCLNGSTIDAALTTGLAEELMVRPGDHIEVATPTGTILLRYSCTAPREISINAVIVNDILASAARGQGGASIALLAEEPPPLSGGYAVYHVDSLRDALTPKGAGSSLLLAALTASILISTPILYYTGKWASCNESLARTYYYEGYSYRLAALTASTLALAPIPFLALIFEAVMRSPLPFELAGFIVALFYMWGAYSAGRQDACI